MNEDWWETVAFSLSYAGPGGDGLGRSYTELLAMNSDHILRDLGRLITQREHNVAAIRGARGG